MSVCQICGDRGYAKQLVKCEQCQSEAVHRYCVVGPAIFGDKDYKWFCEDCVPSKTGPTSPCRKSERLILTVERVASRKIARKKWKAPQIYNSIGAVKETSERVTDPSVVDQKTESKKSNNDIIRGSSDVADISRSEKEDRDEENVLNAYKQRHSEMLDAMRIHKSVSRDADVADPVDNKISNVADTDPSVVDQKTETKKSNNGIKKGSSDVADISSPEKEDFDDENAFNAYKQRNSELFETMRIHKSFSRGADVADRVDIKKSNVLNMQPNCYDSSAARKKRRVVFEVLSSSDEKPDFVEAKRPQLVPNGAEDTSSKLSDSRSKFTDDSFGQLSSVRSVPPRPAPRTVADPMLTREPHVRFDTHIFAQQSSGTLAKQVAAQPLVDAAWRGYCNISDNARLMSLVLEGHLSNKAHNIVEGIVCALPGKLEFALVPKKSSWPISFEKSPPTANGIGLYLFPVDERNEKSYDFLVDKMIDNGLMLKSHINKMELLVFCSRELPQEERTLRRKYYLWGMFKPIMPTTASDFLTRNVQPHVRGEYSSDRFHDQKDLGTTGAKIPSDTCLPKAEVGPSPEWSRRSQSNSKSFEQPRHKQEYRSHQKYGRDRGVSYRKDNRGYWKSWKPRDRDLNYNTRFSDDKKQTDYDGHHSSKWDDQASKRRYRGRRNSRRARRPCNSQM